MAEPNKPNNLVIFGNDIGVENLGGQTPGLVGVAS